jgi:hypothetical protein
MSQTTTINGTIQNVNSVIGTGMNASVVSRRDAMHDKLRPVHGKFLCQASQPCLAAAQAYPAAESWQEPGPVKSWSKKSAQQGLEAPAAAWASLVLSTRAISV